MELYLKRYFWIVRLAFIAIAAVLVARIANTFIGAKIEPPPSANIPELPRSANPIVPVATSIDPVKLGHLFGIEPPPPPPPSETASTGPENTAICWDCAPVKTNLRLQLLGTMAANEKRWSLALITDLDKQSTEYYVIGDEVKGAKVYDIIREPQRVVVVNNETHRLEYIDAVPGSGAAVNTAGLGTLGTAPVPAPNAPSESGPIVASNDAPDGKVEGITQKSENEYSITRQKLDSTLGDLNSVATQARIVPSFKNGVANGFKLFSIRPGSIYSGIGVQNGDVITRINGYDINSPDKALEIYSRLKDARNVEIDIERRGQILKKRYAIE